MDKLKREIGYRPQNVNPKPKEDVTAPTKEVKIEITDILELQKESSKRIVEWIKKHPDFKWTPMCTDLQIDKGYFSRVIKSDLPIFKLEDIPKIEKRIKEYGYM